MDREFQLTVNGHTYQIELHGNSLLVDAQPFVIGQENGMLTVNGIAYDVIVGDNTATVDDKEYRIEIAGMALKSAAKKAPPKRAKAAASAGSVTAIMPGAILKVLVAAGDEVQEGDVVVILEAMKMENEIHAHKSGVVKTVHVTAGDSVENRQALIEIE